MNPPVLVHFGAGNIGRSLVGTVFTRAGYRVCFVDADERVVAALRERRGYRVVIKDDLPPGVPDTIDVVGVDGVSASDPESVASAVAEADLLSTAVGSSVLPVVLRSMARGLARRDRPVSILLCENLHDVAEQARVVLVRELGAGFPLASRVGLVATSIGKMVPILPEAVRERDPLEVWGEAYNQIIADGSAFVGTKPRVPGLLFQENFQAYVERKLYVHNLGHAVCACEGHLRGCVRIAQAMEDPGVAELVRTVMSASARALCQRYPSEFTLEEVCAHVNDLLRRFCNRALGDTVFRVGRDLSRKLAPDDRFIGALRLVTETGGDSGALCDAIASALHFSATDEQGRGFEPDEVFRSRVMQEGVRRVLEEFAGLDPQCYARELARIEARYEDLAMRKAQRGA